MKNLKSTKKVGLTQQVGHKTEKKKRKLEIIVKM